MGRVRGSHARVAVRVRGIGEAAQVLEHLVEPRAVVELRGADLFNRRREFFMMQLAVPFRLLGPFRAGGVADQLDEFRLVGRVHVAHVEAHVGRRWAPRPGRA
jgi:hypothetical protein